MRQRLSAVYALSCLALASVAMPGSLAAQTPSDQTQSTDTQSTSGASQPAKVDPEAVDALQKMGSYLRTLTSFGIRAQITTEKVLDNDQKVQLGGTIDYSVRQPDAFVISYMTDRKVRRYYFDGRRFTIYAPRMGYYSTVTAPGSIRDLFNFVYEKYGIELPLEDLFRWGSPDARHNDLTTAVLVGYAKINGQDTDQFAFREGNSDWQVWIQRGDAPLPLKFVIVDTSDETMPAYTSTLQWDTSATFPDDAFTFRPPSNAKRIPLQPANQ